MSIKVTAEMVKELRERTGVGMGKCKEALDIASGDMEKAIDNLRKSGMASAVKKEGRETREGLIGIGESANSLSIVEINAETDFFTQNDKFREFLKEVAVIAAEKKPSSLEELIHLPAKHDSSISIDQYRALVMQRLGENMQIKRVLILPKLSSSSWGVYSHMNGKIVTAVELGGVGQEALAKEIAMHVAAEAPEYLFPSEVPQEVKAREEEIAKAQVQGKPANIVDKIVEGKLKAFYDQVCLAQQKYVKDNAITITQLLEQEGKKLGQTLTLSRFIYWKVGD